MKWVKTSNGACLKDEEDEVASIVFIEELSMWRITLKVRNETFICQIHELTDSPLLSYAIRKATEWINYTCDYMSSAYQIVKSGLPKMEEIEWEDLR